MSPLDDELIAWLGDAAQEPLAVASIGGKGASLDRLGRLGFRVPPGFCVTTAAFRAQRSALALDAAAGPDVAAARLASQPLDDRVAAALDGALGRLTDELRSARFQPRLAVRSSAVAEDGAASSYAGLHETELDVQPAAVEAAVRRCWASLWSPAAVAYRRRREQSDADAEMAVVVQALVPAEASAVVFTCHPVSGREDQIVLTSTRGLGDAMVAGTITPDTTVVDKASRTILEFDPGDGSTAADGPALSSAALDELIGLGVAVEDRFGLPVDIEAAHAGGAWYLLQARPVTTGSSTDAPVGAV